MTKRDYDEIRNDLLPKCHEIELKLYDKYYAIYIIKENERFFLLLQRIEENWIKDYETLLEIDITNQDGVNKETIDKLFSAPCFDGKSIDDLKDEIKIIGIR